MKWRRWLTLIPWVALGIFLMMALMGEQGILRLWQIQNDTQDLAQELDRSQREALGLESQGRRMRNDPQFIEKVAREELSLVREDELLFRFEE